ncbi:MAG: peptidoglycan DD-metalloendopeptidase family protein [Selenomonadaceae bacterium]|nr:peptidoglycan DD-metalloendopeptidase family protein [Selenomonadaceae bacterium]
MAMSGKKEYTIKFIPSGNGTVHSVRLPARLFQYGLASMAIGALLFVGAFSYAVYSTFISRNNATEIGELRQVNSIQQEQLLQLARKANSLQDQIEQLAQMENELRRLSGIAPSEEAPPSVTMEGDGEHAGQGGPYIQPDVRNVGLALDQVEKELEKRRASLTQLRNQLKERQAQVGPFGFSGIVIPGVGATTPSIWPTDGVVSSPYGLRWNGSDFHPGIDIANDMGTPIVATADGVVIEAGWNSGGYGNMVDIDHGNGIMTRYAHASQVVVTAGQHVRRGQLIAYMGSTGFSTGPHVHYEVRIDGQAVNPVSYLH